jgi:Uma2 family endonuclease
MTAVAERATAILTEAPLVLPAGLGPYRCRDYDELPDRQRCELLLGRFYARPRPSLAHEIVLECVWRHLQGIAAATGGWAYYGPVDLALEGHSVVKPDVFYVSRARRELVSGPGAGTPDLVVEVLSLETARRDRREKVSLYAACGIAEYWLIDPGPQIVDILVNEGGRFVVTLPDDGRHRRRPCRASPWTSQSSGATSKLPWTADGGRRASAPARKAPRRAKPDDS